MKDINLHAYDELFLLVEKMFTISYLQELVRFSGNDLMDDYFDGMPEIALTYLIELQTKQVLEIKEFLSKMC